MSDQEKPSVPAQNLQAEEAVLGAMLVVSATIPAVRRMLKPEHFYRDRHGAIYQAITELADADKPVDVLSVSEALREGERLEQVGGTDVVASIAATVPAPGAATHYAEIVVQNALLRALDRTAKEIQQSIASRAADPFDLVHEAKAKVEGLAVRATDTRRAISLEAEMASVRAEAQRWQTAYERLEAAGRAPDA